MIKKTIDFFFFHYDEKKCQFLYAFGFFFCFYGEKCLAKISKNKNCVFLFLKSRKELLSLEKSLISRSIYRITYIIKFLFKINQ